MRIIFASRLHTDLGTGIFSKICSQISETFGKGRKAGLFVFCTSICISKTDAGINPGFMDINPTAFVTKDFKHRVPPAKIVVGLAIRRNRVNFGRDKFTGYGFEPFIDALTDDRLI